MNSHKERKIFIMKKILVLVLAFMLTLGTVAFAAEFKDMPDDWSTAALTAAVENGLLGGNGGYIYPSDNMTRAEMATIMARACGATKEAVITGFTDVNPDDWFYASMAKAVAMGAFTGSDNKLNPDNPITRQEAFLVLSRVFGLATFNVDTAILDTFKDGNKVDDWAKKGVAAIIASGYVAGNDGYLNPLDNISRAEFAVVMDRLIKYYIDDAEAEIPTDGNVMVRVPGVNLNGIKTDKMIVIGDGVGEGDFEVKDAEILNKLVIRAGTKVSVAGAFTEIATVVPGVVVYGTLDNIERVHSCDGSRFEIPTLIMLPETGDAE